MFTIFRKGDIKMKTRLRSIKALGFFLLIQVLFLGFAEPNETVVKGVNDPTRDIKAVQDAVDRGGTVVLKGIFNFGKDGKIVIKRDIKIIGEVNEQEKTKTQVIGGRETFFSPLPSKEAAPGIPGPKISIENIHFAKANWTPIHIAYTSGAKIAGNKITNVSPFPLLVNFERGDTLFAHAGAILGTRFFNPAKFLPGTTGHLLFENNEVDIPCEKPGTTMGQGVFFVWTYGSIIEAKGNTFRNISRNSIESLENYRDETGVGMVIITGNRIITPTTGCPYPDTTSYPNGIVAGWFLDMSAGQDPDKTSKIIIMNNHIEAIGKLSSGVIGLADGMTVVNNEVVLDGSQSKAILQFGSGGLIAGNILKGSGAFAFMALPYKNEFKGSGNAFLRNDTKLFKASQADFLCEGNDNIYLGDKCNVQGKGRGNKIFVDDSQDR
jgi:hypothetical protein